MRIIETNFPMGNWKNALPIVLGILNKQWENSPSRNSLVEIGFFTSKTYVIDERKASIIDVHDKYGIQKAISMHENFSNIMVLYASSSLQNIYALREQVVLYFNALNISTNCLPNFLHNNELIYMYVVWK